jgi:hypothetical protein
LVSRTRRSLRAPQFFVILAHEFGISIRHRIAVQRYETVGILLAGDFLLQPHAHLSHRRDELLAHHVVVHLPAGLPVLRAERAGALADGGQLVSQIRRVQRLFYIAHAIRPIHIITAGERAAAVASRSRSAVVGIVIQLPRDLGQAIPRASASVSTILSVLILLAPLIVLPLGIPLLTILRLLFALLAILTALTVLTLLTILTLLPGLTPLALPLALTLRRTALLILRIVTGQLLFLIALAILSFGILILLAVLPLLAALTVLRGALALISVLRIALLSALLSGLATL